VIKIEKPGDESTEAKPVRKSKATEFPIGPAVNRPAPPASAAAEPDDD
jgi:hypothetical protein